MNDKAFQRQAQKELIKRDTNLARRAVSEKAKKVLNKPTLDKFDRDWADSGDHTVAAWKVRRLLGETGYEKELRERAERIAEDIKRRHT